MNSKNKYHFEIDSDKIKQQAIKHIEKYINKENEIENYISFEINLIFVFVKILQCNYILYYYQ